MKKHYEISSISFKSGNIVIDIDDKQYTFKLNEISNILAQAGMDDLNRYEISPGGYGIHWPILDEDISIDGLLGVEHKAPDFKKLA